MSVGEVENAEPAGEDGEADADPEEQKEVTPEETVEAVPEVEEQKEAEEE